MVVIAPGDEANLAKRAMVVLETACRETAGVPVRGGENIITAGRQDKQFLVYLSKTPEECAAQKGKLPGERRRRGA